MKKINPDKLWNLYNQDIQKYIKENDFYQLGNTYYTMAEFVKNEGKDNQYLINLGYESKLKFQMERLNEYTDFSIVEKLEIIATDNSCFLCKELNGKIILLKEAIASSPIPVKDCSFSCGCRCVYAPAF